MDEYRQYRVLKALYDEQEWLTRWRLVRKALDHMTTEDRQAVMDYLTERGWIEERIAKKAWGAGAPASQYRLTKDGKKELRRRAAKEEKGMIYVSPGESGPHSGGHSSRPH